MNTTTVTFTVPAYQTEYSDGRYRDAIPVSADDLPLDTIIEWFREQDAHTTPDAAAKAASLLLRQIGDRLMTVLLLFSLFMPTVVLALPLIHLNELLGWLGMPYAVGVAHLAFAVPLSVWILAAGMVRVPVALDEMAMQDGFGFLRFLWQVLLPAVRPHLRGALLVCFMLGWMEFLYARVLGSVVWPPSVVLLSESVMALPLAEGAVHQAEWQVLAAAAWLVMLPVMLAVYALRDQLPDMLSLFRLPSMRARGRRSRGALENA